MSEDHLQGEVSLSAELTPTGVKAGAKSRFISAIDLFFGNAVDLLNPKLEGIKLRERARNAQDVKLIEALGERRVQMLDQDPSYAEQVLEQQLRTSARRLENKAETVRLAIEDLRTTPPTDEQNQAGTEELDPDFLNRFERFAEDATTEQLRERWGRVLAAEIRTPGTFSAKVMRIVDELDANTAILFEKFCTHRLTNAVPAIFQSDITFADQRLLVNADLINDLGAAGQIRLPTSQEIVQGVALDIIRFSPFAIGIPSGASAPSADDPLKAAIIRHLDKPAVPIYLLTPSGYALSSILHHDPEPTIDELCRRISTTLSGVRISCFQGLGATMPLRAVWTDGLAQFAP